MSKTSSSARVECLKTWLEQLRRETRIKRFSASNEQVTEIKTKYASKYVR